MVKLPWLANLQYLSLILPTAAKTRNLQCFFSAPAKKPVKKEASPIEKPTTANDNKKMDVQLKFNFQVDGIKANLINGKNIEIFAYT